MTWYLGTDFCGSFDVPNHSGNEEAWKRGLHYDSKDKEHQISEMSEDYLLNVIRLFKANGYDTTPLSRELERRNFADASEVLSDLT